MYKVKNEWDKETMFFNMQKVERLTSLYEELRYNWADALNSHCLGFKYSDRLYNCIKEVLQNNNFVLIDGLIKIELLPAEVFSYNHDSRNYYREGDASFVTTDLGHMLIFTQKINGDIWMIIDWDKGWHNSYFEQNNQGLFRLLGQGVRVYDLSD